MEAPNEKQALVLAMPTTSYEDLLGRQRDLLLNQVENLQEILSTQCKLTGVNPLSQEMAAGALSIKIGKKPRDLMNPRAVKYMQFIFSIKDAISKRETREISAQFGVTVTQVKDFFASQRARVRKFATLSAAKIDKSAAYDVLPGEMALDPIMTAEPIPLDTMAPAKNEEGTSCSTGHEALSGMEESDRNFTENIFKLMRKEESFAGHVKLLQWILRMENTSVLNWFLTEGGVLILATWLSEAATEEQSSVLRLILKVFCHLPLKKAHPVHMSAVLQSVNTLRFYRTPDISNRSRHLLAQWSNTFLKMRASSKSRSVSDAHDEMLLKQSIDEVMCNQSWGLKDDTSEEAVRFLCHNPDYQRKLDTASPLKLLTASEDDTSKKRGVLSSHIRERRKVQMVEHPVQRLATRHPQIAKSTAATRSRPLSADDIQKAKMRAQFLHSKHGKSIVSSDDQVKPEIQNRGTSLLAKVSPSVSTSHGLPEPVEQRKVENAVTKVASPVKTLKPEPVEQRKVENSVTKVVSPVKTLNFEEPPWKKYKKIQISWMAPPEVKIMDEWHVETGANSKEVEVQKNRIKREREIIYRTVQEIPSNPREPWDREMDYDETLTPEIPIEQLPDVEPLETPTGSSNNEHVTAVASSSSSTMPEPDLELLAELLKNPELVFALTSGQTSGLTSHDTVKLLDLIKSNGAGVLTNLAVGVNRKNNGKVEVSLPSPTPSSDIVPNGQKPDYSRNPFSRSNGNPYQAPQPSPIVQQLAHTVVPPVVFQQAMHLPEQWHTPSNTLIHHQNVNSSNIHFTQENMINGDTMVNFNRASNNTNQVEPLGLSRLPLQSPYSQEPIRQGFESIYHHQNNPTLNTYNGGTAQAGAWVGRNNLVEMPGFETWGSHNSPSRPHEYIPGQNYQEPSLNHRHGYLPPSGYRDQGTGGVGNKRWRDQGR